MPTCQICGKAFPRGKGSERMYYDPSSGSYIDSRTAREIGYGDEWIIVTKEVCSECLEREEWGVEDMEWGWDPSMGSLDDFLDNCVFD